MTANLVKGSVVRSPITGRRYELEKVIGYGGYGRVYRALDLKTKTAVCLKYTYDQTSWHRESYFGELLRRNRRVIQLYDSFPVMPTGTKRGRIRYCLVFELAEHGTVADYLARTEEPWPEARAKREIIALLKLLDQLHGGSATHRDITPFNIFVCKNGILKLGDFGIARHELAGRPTKPDAFNPDYVTRGFLDSEHRAWTAVDDVFQMGQLLALLLLGENISRVKRKDVRYIDASRETKNVIRRALGQRSRRFADAWEMLSALRGETPAAVPKISSLRGRAVTFSGPLSITRADAELLVSEVGGRVTQRVSRETDVLVLGRSRSREGSRPAKLARAERLIKQGARLSIVSEAEFRHLLRAEVAPHPGP